VCLKAGEVRLTVVRFIIIPSYLYKMSIIYIFFQVLIKKKLFSIQCAGGARPILFDRRRFVLDRISGWHPDRTNEGMLDRAPAYRESSAGLGLLQASKATIKSSIFVGLVM